MPSERVQILLKPDQRRALAIRARATGRSVSDLVREAVDSWMGSEKETRFIRALALENAAQLRQQIAARRGNSPLVDAVQVLDQVRSERTDDLNRR